MLLKKMGDMGSANIPAGGKEIKNATDYITTQCHQDLIDIYKKDRRPLLDVATEYICVKKAHACSKIYPMEPELLKMREKLEAQEYERRVEKYLNKVHVGREAQAKAHALLLKYNSGERLTEEDLEGEEGDESEQEHLKKKLREEKYRAEEGDVEKLKKLNEELSKKKKQKEKGEVAREEL